jgi:mannose-6-phosphate isomerase-like protein (cupin superfamily)
MADHKTVIVRKPWGYEYLAYQNAHVAMWVLHIRAGERTSLHCHPTKSTGLVVVSGTAEINFIADSRTVTAPGKQMIRRGLFHQTHAITDTIMLEIETPVDKDDLVRLKDNYGRTAAGYEGSEFELPKSDECLWINEPSTGMIHHYELGQCHLAVESVTDIHTLNNKNDSDLLMFLKGGLSKTVNGRNHLVTAPGDVGQVSIIRQVSAEMDGFAHDTMLMTITSL